MIDFHILKQSSRSRARLGILKTSHGEVETPCLVPVATQAVVKTLTSEEAVETGSQMLIANTYHLHLYPGEAIVKRAGGIHEFMHWRRPLMTDSGGFQVFSLGFGKDLAVNKITHTKSKTQIEQGRQPKLLSITDDGVEFRSHRDGRKLFIGPKESIRIQTAIGADIAFAFDECPPPHASRAYMTQSVSRTHRWEIVSLKYHSHKQALYGIVQGGRYKELRMQSAQFIARLPFDGFSIGGEFGDNKSAMTRMLNVVMRELPDEKPRHLLGVGHLEDIESIIKSGIDTFDCTVPTHYARHGVAFTSHGRLDMYKQKFLTDKNPLDTTCACIVCQSYRRNYITHLLRAREITALKLLTFHNLHFFHSLISSLRNKIKEGKL
ncbi:hypothetical protein A3J43_00215 [Candidatus Uhrbacteria bacterium RIFCSPHIGHO2_12_FULL_54_23]|uniref:Queuine tRNA-ribosyltransferase n=3 Tax=Candidatus Uhriibacteriota TaxID=1752732 RepID=A0A1F7UH89_9BACT|nr:MAG: hypothetical protein A3J43_00215 [Candidatus Uhrbacteria bacterium RIFCSPHIGHO2_12_FULL_54_23]OGL85511.1 MAG: hypothetical protein A3B36_00855 [Candidatus Uhrbacteria bacterium RIFCSPLOWO2_01_FULL_55_36]OGL89642.1 MAG: hypothetical protein A3J36_02080 [Candidatus Uhrbacteria bacterium RIFCSPLOWO2_02_FULL_54_37]